MNRDATIPPALLSTPIAHRGLHNGTTAPENSLPAFENAILQGLPIELDVHLLKDGTVAVFHDAELLRLTGKEGLLAELNYSELKSLRLCGTDAEIPDLKQVLDLVAGRSALLIELKSHTAPGPLEEAVCACLKGYGGEVAIQSFHQPTLAYFCQRCPHVARGMLSGGTHGLPGWAEASPHFIGYAHHSLPHPEVSAQRSAGTPVLAWTVRSASEWNLVLPHADNIIFEAFPAYQCGK